MAPTEKSHIEKAALRSERTPPTVVGLRTFIIIFNLGIVLACTFVLIYQEAMSLSRFFLADQATLISVLPSQMVQFVAFTVCPSYYISYNRTYLSSIGTAYSTYITGQFFGTLPLNFTVSGFDIYDTSTFKLVDFLQSVTLTTSTASNTTVVTNITAAQPLGDPSIMTVNTKYTDTYGKCFEITLNETVVDLGILTVEFMSSMDIYTYLHHPGQFTGQDSKTKVCSNTGQRMSMQLTIDVTVDTLEEQSQSPCNASMNLLFDQCVYAAYGAKLMAQFGCVVPWVPRNNSWPVCRIQNSTIMSQFMTYQKSLLAYQTLTMCQQMCSTMDVFAGNAAYEAVSPSVTFTTLNLKSTTKQQTVVLDYSVLSMLAELGGYTGLWLGLSVINVSDMLEWAILGKKKDSIFTTSL